MLGIKIANEFLDLTPETIMELEAQNPLLEFTEELRGQNSFPLDVRLNEKNLRLLNYAGYIQKPVDYTGVDAIVYDNGLQVSIGKIKIEKIQHNLNRMADGSISIYYLTGSSSFFQDIKDKKLQDIDVGGDRSFPWDGYTYTPGGPGFGDHITDVVNGGAGYGISGHDYAFFPVVNKGWPGALLDPDLMNFVFYEDSIVKFGADQAPYNGRNPNRIIPFPYLKYVLVKAVQHVGWDIEGDILDDPDFIKITLINFHAIFWAYVKKSSGSHHIVPNDTITFNLQDNLPDLTIAEFLIALKNRFGWKYDFDKLTKTIKVRTLTQEISGPIKQFTKYASPVIPKKINQDKKIYALRNQFSTQLGDGQPNFKLVTRDADVGQIADLPAAAEALYGHVRLVVAENNFYICQQNQGTEAWEWVFFAYNIYDYEPPGANEEITTAATTVGVEYYNPYLDLIPRIDHEGTWYGSNEDRMAVNDWGIILAFYHGLKNNKADQPYPYASSHIYDSKFNQVADWALTFECKKQDGSEVGLYELSWKPMLNILNSNEEFEVTLALPRHEYLNLGFGDRILIDGVKMFISQQKSKVPYKGQVDITAVRIT